MTNRVRITRQAARDGVPAPTVERDYVLAHIIAALGAIDTSHGLVCKGRFVPRGVSGSPRCRSSGRPWRRSRRSGPRLSSQRTSGCAPPRERSAASPSNPNYR